MNFVAISQLWSTRDAACKAQRTLLTDGKEQDYVRVSKKQNRFYHQNFTFACILTFKVLKCNFKVSHLAFSIFKWFEEEKKFQVFPSPVPLYGFVTLLIFRLQQVQKSLPSWHLTLFKLKWSQTSRALTSMKISLKQILLVWRRLVPMSDSRWGISFNGCAKNRCRKMHRYLFLLERCV